MPKILNLASDESINDLKSITIDKLCQHPWVNCHFDFERRNLVLDKNNHLTVIDYQDMKKGPIGIDMAGILVDHYFEADVSTLRVFKFFSTNVKSEYSNDACLNLLDGAAYKEILESLELYQIYI